MESPNLRIIPSMLLFKGRLVKGVSFKNHLDVGNPATTCKALESQKADEIIIIDLESYREPKKEIDYKSLSEISKNLLTSITFGGGITSLKEAKKCFKNGADKIYISNILFKNIEIVKKISNVFGNQSIVCGINVTKKQGKYLIFENENLDLFDWLKKINKLPIGEIKVTFVNSEGTKKGLDIEICKKIIEQVNHPVVIEGGIGHLTHIKQIAELPVSGIALGTMLNFTDQNIIKIKQYLTNQKFKVRN
jgi:imidazole glycerol-phosphate synthase subunit HisF